MATKKSAEKTVVKHPGETRLAFIRSVKLAGLGLDEVSALVDRTALLQAKAREAEITAELSIGHGVADHMDDHFTVVVRFTVVQKEDGAEANLVSINGSFSARFDLTKKASKEAVNAFAHLEARLVFFPYLRHFISDICHRMAIDPIILPMSSELENRN